MGSAPVLDSKSVKSELLRIGQIPAICSLSTLAGWPLLSALLQYTRNIFFSSVMAKYFINRARMAQADAVDGVETGEENEFAGIENWR